jgi:hypothetical protein
MMNPIYYSEYNYSNNNFTNKYIKKPSNLINKIDDFQTIECNNIDIIKEINNLNEINNNLDEIDSNFEEINSNLIEKSNDTQDNINININNVSARQIKNEINDSKNNIIKQYILNPLTAIIKLSILSCKPIGTKIHIQNNVIYFQEPGIFQSLTRYIFKSNKSHLQYIYNPIKFACQKYLTKDFIRTTPNIVNLFTSAKLGIENLIKTYSTCPITVLCLKYYYVIIENSINQTSKEFIYKEPINDNYNVDETREFYTSELLEKFEKQWNSSKLKIILDLMDFLLNYDVSENKTNNIKSLETIINNSDEDTQKIING